MSYLAGVTVISLTAAAPNMGRGESGSNVSPVKQFRVGGKVYPYISAQAWRRWLRDTIAADGETPSPVEFGAGKKQQAYTAGRPDQFFDDDVFGYMRALAGKETQRETVLSTSLLASAIGYRHIPSDFGTMTRGISARTVDELGTGKSSSPLLHEHEFFSGDMVGTWLFDLPRVGRFPVDPDGPRLNFLTNEAQEARDNGATDTTLRGWTALELDLGTRRSRVARVLEAMAAVQGGAKRNSNYTDLTPALVLVAPMKGGVNPFTKIVTTEADGSTVIALDVIEAEVVAWADELDGPVYLGWRPGFLPDQRAKVVAAHGIDLDGAGIGDIVIDHPRTVLRHVAQAVRSGLRDGWLDTP